MSVCVCGGAGGASGGSTHILEEVPEAVQRGEENHRGELHSRGGFEGERVLAFKVIVNTKWRKSS